MVKLREEKLPFLLRQEIGRVARTMLAEVKHGVGEDIYRVYRQLSSAMAEILTAPSEAICQDRVRQLKRSIKQTCRGIDGAKEAERKLFELAEQQVQLGRARLKDVAHTMKTQRQENYARYKGAVCDEHWQGVIERLVRAKMGCTGIAKAQRCLPALALTVVTGVSFFMGMEALAPDDLTTAVLTCALLAMFGIAQNQAERHYDEQWELQLKQSLPQAVAAVLDDEKASVAGMEALVTPNEVMSVISLEPTALPVPVSSYALDMNIKERKESEVAAELGSLRDGQDDLMETLKGMSASLEQAQLRAADSAEGHSAELRSLEERSMRDTHEALRTLEEHVQQSGALQSAALQADQRRIVDSLHVMRDELGETQEALLSELRDTLLARFSALETAVLPVPEPEEEDEEAAEADGEADGAAEEAAVALVDEVDELMEEVVYELEMEIDGVSTRPPPADADAQLAPEEQPATSETRLEKMVAEIYAALVDAQFSRYPQQPAMPMPFADSASSLLAAGQPLRGSIDGVTPPDKEAAIPRANMLPPLSPGERESPSTPGLRCEVDSDEATRAEPAGEAAVAEATGEAAATQAPAPAAAPAASPPPVLLSPRLLGVGAPTTAAPNHVPPDLMSTMDQRLHGLSQEIVAKFHEALKSTQTDSQAAILQEVHSVLQELKVDTDELEKKLHSLYLKARSTLESACAPPCPAPRPPCGYTPVSGMLQHPAEASQSVLFSVLHLNTSSISSNMQAPRLVNRLFLGCRTMMLLLRLTRGGGGGEQVQLSILCNLVYKQRTRPAAIRSDDFERLKSSPLAGDMGGDHRRGGCSA
eukprot:gene20705-24813_t